MKDNSNDSLIVRVKPAVWVGIMLLLASSLPLLMMATSPSGSISVNTPQDRLTRIVILVFAWVACVAVLWAQRTRIVLDSKGLRWRSLTFWKSAGWEQVEDFYLLSDNQEGAAAVITSAGKLEISPVYGNLTELRDHISLYATNARNPEWAAFGTRPHEKWPLIFHYATQSNQLIPIALGLCLSTIVPAAVMLARQAVHVAKSVGSAWNGAYSLATALLISAPIMLLIVVFRTALTAHSDVRRRHSQRVTADEWGLLFEDGTASIRAPWQDITECALQEKGRKGTHITSSAGQFDFTSQISEVEVLQRIIGARVVAVGTPSVYPDLERATLDS